MSTAVAILAAGRGARLGGEASKPLLEWRGRPLVAWALDAVLGSGLGPVLVVVGYRGDEVRAALALGPPRTGAGAIEVVENREWQEGIASSLRAALRALGDRTDVDAVCVGLADQPRVGAEAYRRVAAATGELVVPTYAGHPGNPVKLARSLWPEALELRGDVGARALVRDHAVTRVECADTGSAADVDTLDDLERMQQEGQ